MKEMYHNILILFAFPAFLDVFMIFLFLEENFFNFFSIEEEKRMMCAMMLLQKYKFWSSQK